MGKPKFEIDIQKFAKVVHPSSRKAKQLNKKIHKEVNKVKKKSTTNMRLQLLGKKLFWFKERLDSENIIYMVKDVEDLICRYIDRNDEEMGQINFKNQIGHRKNCHASREDVLRISKENELAEFNNSGFETIDLTDSENLTAFKLWNGELRFISNFKLKKFIRSNRPATSKQDAPDGLMEEGE